MNPPDWNLISQIATAISAVLAATSVVAGFILYRMSKRDAYISAFRKSITEFRARAKRLDRVLNHELSNEAISTVISSPEMCAFLSDVHQRFVAKESSNKNGLKEYLDSNCPLITVSLQTPLIHAYSLELTQMEFQTSEYAFDFPGYSRVARCIYIGLSHALNNQKRIASEEDLWKSVIRDDCEAAATDSLDLNHFVLKIKSSMIVLGAGGHQKLGAKPLNELLNIADLIVDAYLQMDGPTLMKNGAFEQKQSMKSLLETDTIPEDLLEAEKCFSKMFTRQQALAYREIVTRYSSYFVKDNPSS